MIFSHYLFKLPYSLTWHLLKRLKRLEKLVFYCGDPIDYHAFLPLLKHFDRITFVTDKPLARSYLLARGISPKRLPAFPAAVIMARHATHKFPCGSIVRIGMRHGPYHFKRMTSAASYNSFDLYLMTSEADVEAGKALGIRSAMAVGYPKLDEALNGTLDDAFLNMIRQKLQLDPAKSNVMFCATYDSSGMSAVSLWVDRLPELATSYNILVTLHPWIKHTFREHLQTMRLINLVREYDVLPYLMLADAVVGDASSMLAEACALDKPIITFRTGLAVRRLEEIDQLLGSISYSIDGFEELPSTLEHALQNPAELAEARKQANLTFFGRLDGKATERAAEAIRDILYQRKLYGLV